MSCIALGKLARPRRVCRVVLQQLAILFQGRSAAGRVGDDGVVTALRQRRRYCAAPACGPHRASPACTCSAPQQPWPAGTTTSQPFFCSTRTVASFSRAKHTLAMQPAINATRWRRSPSAGNVLPIWLKKNGGSAGRRKLLQVAQPAQQLQRSPARAPAPWRRWPGKDRAACPRRSSARAIPAAVRRRSARSRSPAMPRGALRCSISARAASTSRP